MAATIEDQCTAQTANLQFNGTVGAATTQPNNPDSRMTATTAADLFPSGKTVIITVSIQEPRGTATTRRKPTMGATASQGDDSARRGCTPIRTISNNKTSTPCHTKTAHTRPLPQQQPAATRTLLDIKPTPRVATTAQSTEHHQESERSQ